MDDAELPELAHERAVRIDDGVPQRDAQDLVRTFFSDLLREQTAILVERRIAHAGDQPIVVVVVAHEAVAAWSAPYARAFPHGVGRAVLPHLAHRDVVVVLFAGLARFGRGAGDGDR